jgi:hypothetical protein
LPSRVAAVAVKSFARAATSSSHHGNNLHCAVRRYLSEGRGRIALACQEIAARYGSVIEAIARNPYYTSDQRAAMIAGLRQQQKAEIAAVRARIQYEERERARAQGMQMQQLKAIR